MSPWTLAALLLLGYLVLLPCMLGAGWRLGWPGAVCALAVGVVLTGLLWIDRPPGQGPLDLVGTFALVALPLLACALVGVGLRRRRDDRLEGIEADEG
jgi:apolipoprotein N-acyltransferase